VSPQRGIAVLAYHGTGATRTDPWWIDFRGQMQLLDDLGYRVITLDEAVTTLRQREPILQPTAVLTFDDGFANNLDVAFPELARRGWPATVFIATGYMGRRPYLYHGEVPLLKEMGIAIGNHTHSHVDVTTIDPASLRAELQECSNRLEDLTGERPRHFLYPNGKYNAAARMTVASLGFRSACSGRVGRNAGKQDLYVLRRLTIERGEGARALRTRLSGGYDFLDARQAWMDAA
jgi:peptidoglycan/xylan/chitin deacetylase (PgdA/CDA1 family)